MNGVRTRSGAPARWWIAACIAWVIGAAGPEARAEGPENPHGSFQSDCAQCHRADSWKPAVYAPDWNHARYGMPLTGGHASVGCRQCHESLDFPQVPRSCAECHVDAHGRTLGADCARCHTLAAFDDRSGFLNMHEQTRLPLQGAHAATTCDRCHPDDGGSGARYHETPSECQACHESELSSVTEPDHRRAGFGPDCQACHGTTQWAGAKFNHDFFPLSGVHATAGCNQCHVDGPYQGASAECFSCHETDFNEVVDPSHVSGGFSHDCTSCHAATGWDGATFVHSSFELTGPHAAASCADCHAGGAYGSTSSECYFCHEPDYNSAVDPNHVAGNYAHDCTSCHEVNSWENATFEHVNFPLALGHADLACAACHAGDSYQATSVECVSCHREEFDETKEPDHAAAAFELDCSTCHTVSDWAGAVFDHGFFPLTDGHAESKCSTCHIGGPFEATSAECVACHEADYQATTEPPHPAAGFSTDCAGCHNAVGWAGATFDHGFFPLTAGHATAACADCHADGVYAETPPDCFSCHADDFASATNPDHVAGVYPRDCTSCHSMQGWSGATFEHTSFPLEGGHSSLRCADCHAGGSYPGTPAECVACHQDDFSAAVNPNHADAGFEHDCTGCHTVNGWDGATFDHAFFPLTGGHGAPACASCHVSGPYAETSAECFSCHAEDYNAAAAPPHAAAGFSHDCTTCHSTAGWPGAAYDHTVFPLNGGHAALQCADCHGGGDYLGISPDCFACHADDFAATVAPDHETVGFPHDCLTCHTVAGWAGAVFEHTGFPLTGGHSGAACSDCHAGGVYQGTSSECYACHQDDFSGTTDPAHPAAGFDHDCTTCHSVAGWSGATYDHGFYPLAGPHAAARCADCHGSGIYEGTSSECFACHEDDFNGTTDPNHVTEGFSHDCTTCHTVNGWDGANIDHGTFPMTGGHAALTCVQCHANGSYSGTSPECFACHANDFGGTTDPDHAAAGFSHDCTTCHTVADWAGGIFDHGFHPLTGGHAAAGCADCHSGGVYAGTSTDCFACHADDFNGTTDPSHVAEGFSHDCTICHTVSGWDGANIDHGTFPMTGGHAALTCAQCHANGSYSGTSPECFSCHADDFAGTTDPDHDAAGFSHDCTACHTVNGWDGGTYSHAFFPLSDGHSGLNCVDCHATGIYEGTWSECYPCHVDDFNGTTDPNHVTEGFSHDCTSCHTVSGWDGANIDHGTFPMTGGHAALTCVQCHANGSYSGTSPECFSCHADDFAGTVDPDHDAAGFTHDCTACHTVNGWDGGSYNHGFFPLSDGHSGLNCVDCHATGIYEGTSSECYPCHVDDFNGTTDPNHVTEGFSHDCTTCHTVSGWDGANIDHGTFPMTGGHAALTCVQCHANGSYSGTSPECFACHADDFAGTVDPDHESGNFPHDCLACHDVNGWEGATYDHSFFPLSGGHAAVDCAECHVNGNYQNTPNDCYLCHSADFNGALDPNHLSAHFPTDCVLCHTVSGWEDATFDHDADYFPIYTGKHRNKWSSCADCHLSPGEYGTFSCLEGCHEHGDQQEVDNDHDEVSGYQYDSAHCLSCHPDGSD